MANHNAGNTLQKALAEGRANQCTATCKETGERCRRAARIGFNTCLVHGAGSLKRENEGLAKPVDHSLSFYASVMGDVEDRAAFDEVLADLSLVQEAAMAKVLLRKVLKLALAETEDFADEDGDVDCEDARPGKSSKKDKDFFKLIKVLEMTVKTVGAAYDQIRDKKIIISFDDDNIEKVEVIREKVREELKFINNLLCSDCKRRVVEAMIEKQGTILE